LELAARLILYGQQLATWCRAKERGDHVRNFKKTAAKIIHGAGGRFSAAVINLINCPSSSGVKLIKHFLNSSTVWMGLAMPLETASSVTIPFGYRTSRNSFAIKTESLATPHGS
jgi:hypothetical protein